jgi:hypothetical protein
MDTIDAFIARTTAASGVPVTVEDPGTLNKVATVLRHADDPRPAATRTKAGTP